MLDFAFTATAENTQDGDKAEDVGSALPPKTGILAAEVALKDLQAQALQSEPADSSQEDSDLVKDLKPGLASGDINLHSVAGRRFQKAHAKGTHAEKQQETWEL